MANKCTNCDVENTTSAKYCSGCGFKLPTSNTQNETIATPKNPVKTDKKTNLKTNIGFAIGFVVMFFIGKSFFSPSIDKSLIEISNEINKSCPIRVDQFTTLKNTSVLPSKTLRYNYTLEDITKSEVNLDTVRKYVFASILENVKTSPDMKTLRDHKVILSYYYSDKNGTFVTEYKVTPEMYKE